MWTLLSSSSDFVGESLIRFGESTGLAGFFSAMGWGNIVMIGIAFFLLNVLLGVVGTFWYRTQQRSAEIGLRMAMGATRKGIFWQLVKEGLALLTIAFIPSTVIFANLLHMEVTQGSEIPPDMASRLLFGFVFSYAVMAAMIVVGISFPSYRAMRMHPADALRQE
jgi:putative ABC transport system permease protein